ncbi:hypothetical protein R3W88_008382 [Solanum pinnatisectum]|uniref:Uncharacterized protein n=1 Tax=Solanum pinnatisectum TaxID=50273 RepID=A0AAV9M854_9SOLN|nr:hypothetical protein R3W88_008382 [Solanum pinnatisectum]
MEEGDSPVRIWEDLNNDISVKILQTFDIFELSAGLAHVCNVWRLACCDQLPLKTLDLSYPRLKCLVMPSWNKIKKRTICIWEDLESLTRPSIKNPGYVIEENARRCKKNSELKIIGPCDMLFASVLVSFLPNLKLLSLRCTGLKKLKVLNISHCIITEDPPPAPMKILTKLDESILEKASRLDKFLTLITNSCIKCQHNLNDEGLMRWYENEEDLWKVDEVRSLAI